MKEMMKHKMMNRFHRRNSSSSSSLDFKSGEKLDFKFSSLQALQVPAGWDKLTVSLISVETDKTVTKTGKASVYNGNCRWTESLSESIWISQDDSSKELQQCLYKLLISKGSTRSGILGEVTVNLSNYFSSETSLPVALPLKKCDHGTILQVAIQCLNPRANLRSRDSNSVAEDVNSEYSDLDNMSDAPHGTNNNNVGSSSTDSVVDASPARALGSRATSSSTVRSYHSFDSMDDSFGRESSLSNLSEVTVDLIGRPESTGLVNVYDSPKSNRSGKNLLNQRQDSGKVSHIPASPLRTFHSSSEFVLEADVSTPEELRAEARSWERNARKLKVDLDLSRNETINQTKHLENVTMELSALQKECNGLKDENKHLKILLGESAVKERDAVNLKNQVQDNKDIQVKLEEEIKFQKNLNDDLALQLSKTQESNLELVSVLQELEETIEKQRMEIESRESSEQQPAGDSWNSDVELQKHQESQKRLEDMILNLEKTLEEKSQTLVDNESKWRQELHLKDEEINNLKAKLSEAVAVPVLNETESRTIETRDLDEEVKALREKVLELERDCNELTDENLDLLYKLKESNNDLSTDGGSVTSSVHLSDLKLVNDRLEESLKVMQKELDDTKDSHISGTKILEKKILELETHNHELEMQLAELEEENLHLSGRIAGLEPQLRYLTDDRESSRLEAEHSESQNSSLKDQLQRLPVLQDEIVALKNSLNDMKFENERLSASLQMVSDDYQQLKEENTSLVEKVSNMQKSMIELEDHKRNKIVLEEKILRLQGDLTAREALGAQDAELKNEVGRLKRSNSQLQWKINRLQEEKDEYIKKTETLEEQKQNLKPNEHEAISISTGLDSTSVHEETKITEDAEVNKVDSRIQSLEVALAEALEANEMYKLQLKSFVSEGPARESDVNKEHKNEVSSLERELSELQERYLHMSLKYAEVEAQREELVLKLKAIGPGRSWFS
ncbi:putative transcription factor bZIP family [Helianthus annuus]|nr:putative transcription factor bZIP family [Helianthus annuus]